MLYERLGYQRWGTHPYYARVGGKWIAGHFYSKVLNPGLIAEGARKVILYPAIDLKNGQCVRLVRGDMAQATVFNAEPADQARRFADAGAAWLHVVDLNGAFEGRPVNAGAVEGILGGDRSAGAARRRHPQPGDDRDAGSTPASRASSSAPSR